MAFNYINGIQMGSETSVAPGYGHGMRQMRRMLYVWLTKVVGWQSIETSTAAYDTPQLAVRTDGATDASNVRRFTSATGGFTGAMEGSHLVIHPTSAPTTIGAFTDPTRNGLYEIRRVYDTNTIDVETFNGVHTDGLPLNETGVRFEVHRFRDASTLTATADYYVIRGTGRGGTFDVKITEDLAVNYAPTKVIVSPWADWSAGAPGSWSPGTRITTETSLAHAFDSDLVFTWAVADLTQCIVWCRGYTYEMLTTSGDGEFLYIGDLDPFHAASDLRPVVVTQGLANANVSDYTGIQHNTRMVAGDDTTQVTSRMIYASKYANVATSFHGSEQATRSYHSGRYLRSPLIVFEETAGNEEIRGQLKNVELGHRYGPNGPIPLGTSRDRLRLTDFVIPWNGSKVYRYMFY